MNTNPVWKGNRTLVGQFAAARGGQYDRII